MTRGRTIAGSLRLVELRAGIELETEGAFDYQRPKTRADCIDGPRPCPFVSCRYHLFLEVTKRGALKLNFPHLDVTDMEHSCALDLADEGRRHLREVADRMNLSHERVRQIQNDAMAALQQAEFAREVAGVFGDEVKIDDVDEWRHGRAGNEAVGV